jgi:hypothetical protein
MEIASAQAASLVARPEASTLGLQINQRFAAEVLNVSGDQVTLMLEGTPFVARLTSADQASALQNQRVASFVVRENTGTLVQLQLLPRAATAPDMPVETARQVSNLVPNLLRLSNIPVNEANTYIAEALLKQGLPINAETMQDLRSALSVVPGWGQAAANQAAMLKAAGLPLTPETLMMALSQSNFAALTEMINKLRGRLEQAAKDNPQKAVQLTEMLAVLNKMTVEWNGENANLVDQLRQALANLGRPIEGELARFLQDKIPDLRMFAGQAAFEKDLAEFIKSGMPYLSSEDQAALQKELLQYLFENLNSLSTATGKDALAQELNGLLHKFASQILPEGLLPFDQQLTSLIQQHIQSLNTPEGMAAFEQELQKLLQNNLPAAAKPEEWAVLARQLAQLVQENAAGLSTPQGTETLKGQILLSLQQNPNLSGLENQDEFLAGLTELLKRYQPSITTPEGQAALAGDLTRLIQNHAAPTLSLENQAGFSQELARLLAKFTADLKNPEAQAALGRDLTKLVHSHLTLSMLGGGSGFERELTRFLQANTQIVDSTARAAIEKEMQKLLQNAGDFWNSVESKTGMVSLARLRNELSGTNLDSLMKDVDRLLERMRWMQFENVQPQTKPLKEQWLELELPFAGQAAPGQSQPASVHIRVSYQGEDKKRKIDPNNTHIMLHFDLGMGEEDIDVDLAVVERKIGAQVMVSSTDLQPIAEDELPLFADGLEEIGYFLQTARCDIKRLPVEIPAISEEDAHEFVPDYAGKLNIKA